MIKRSRRGPVRNHRVSEWYDPPTPIQRFRFCYNCNRLCEIYKQPRRCAAHRGGVYQ